MTHAENPLIQRQKHILEAQSGDLTGYLYPTRLEAETQMCSLLRETGKGGFYDLDDTSFLSEAYLRFFLEEEMRRRGAATVSHKSVDEVVAAGGRYFQVPEYQEAARELGIPFRDLYRTVATSREAHARMRPVNGVLQFQRELDVMGFPTCGYPTARPDAIIPVSAASLKYWGFDRAPVLDVEAELADPSDAKLMFMNRVLEQSPDAGPVVFVDDHVPTAIKLHDAFPGRVIPLVPLVPRNRHQAPLLAERGIIHGTFPQLVTGLQNISPSPRR